MEPLISNSSSNNCGITISSNCVPYTGKPIPCIGQCNTDSVSDIEYKLGNSICYIKTLLDLSTLDLTCFYTPCPSCQNPTKLQDILQLMINYMCAQQVQITTLQSTVNTLTGGR